MIVPKLDVGNREALVLGVFGEGKNMEEETRGEKRIYGNYVESFCLA